MQAVIITDEFANIIYPEDDIVIFPQGFNQKIKPGTIPRRITKMVFNDEYSRDLTDVIPEWITHLVIGKGFSTDFTAFEHVKNLFIPTYFAQYSAFGKKAFMYCKIDEKCDENAAYNDIASSSLRINGKYKSIYCYEISFGSIKLRYAALTLIVDKDDNAQSLINENTKLKLEIEKLKKDHTNVIKKMHDQVTSIENYIKSLM